MSNYNKYRKYKSLYKTTLSPSIAIEGGSNQYQAITEKPNEILGCKRVVYFFDNDANNFVDYTRCICVIPIEIPESKRIATPDGNYAFTDLSTYQNYISKLSPGAQLYANSVKKRKGIDSYDPVSGISCKDLEDYTSKLNNNTFRDRLAAMIFDWDRTLTVMEGVPARYKSLSKLITHYQEKYDMSNSVSPRDIVEYYFGGNRRMLLIKKLGEALNGHNKLIYVLSANSGLSNHTDFFHEMLQIVGINIPVNHLIYKGNMSKYQYIEDALPNLCIGN